MQVTCPHCQKPVSAREELSGQGVICPHCQHGFTMPIFGGTPAAATHAFDDEPQSVVVARMPNHVQKLDRTLKSLRAPIWIGAIALVLLLLWGLSWELRYQVFRARLRDALGPRSVPTVPPMPDFSDLGR